MKQQNNKITIAKLSHDGRGIGNIEGKTHFIANALPGETVEFNYLRKHRKFDEGFAHTILDAAPERIEAKCQHFTLCGGCQIQHMSLDQQLSYKQKTVLEMMEHIGKTQPKEILPPITASEFAYRSKARLGVKYVQKKEKVLVGFREVYGRFIADLESCPVLVPSVGTRLTELSSLIETLSCKDKIAQIEVAESNGITSLTFRHLEVMTEQDLQKLKQFGKDYQFMICLQPGNYDSIHQIYPTEEIPKLHYQIPEHEIDVEFHPSDFTQVNYQVNLKMIDKAIELLAPSQEDKILDLFCGLGNFTLPLSKYVKTITGVEGDQKMVDKAKLNATRNQCQNTDFYAANLFEDYEHLNWAKQTYDKILLDPPRAGAEKIAQNINKFSAKDIVYISCNPSTLARDAHEIIKNGYTLSKLGIINMFPQTAHVETIALFQK